MVVMIDWSFVDNITKVRRGKNPEFPLIWAVTKCRLGGTDHAVAVNTVWDEVLRIIHNHQESLGEPLVWYQNG